MTGFKFPPPPPPPPRAAANDAQGTYTSQRGGSNNLRGDGGRGRGWGSRGRGNDSRGNTRGNPTTAQSGGSRRGAYENTQPNGGARDVNGILPSGGNSRGVYSHVQSNRGARGGHGRGVGGGSRGGFQHRRKAEHQEANFSAGQGQQQQQSSIQHTSPPSVPPLPAGAYVNPLFANQMQVGTPMPTQVNPLALAQAMAFMATPAGVQTMAAFSTMVGGANTQFPQSTSSSSSPSFQQQSQQSSPQTTRKKQNKTERAVNWTAEQKFQSSRKSHPPKQKPPRAKAIPPPSVPGFGFSLPSATTLKRPTTQKGDGRGCHKKRKVHLGLTQQMESESDSNNDDEDADADEETILASKIINTGLIFQHEGLDISLQTPAEIAAWIKDRKRQYPTTKRIAEKAKEQAEKRASELEFLRKIKGHTEKQKHIVREAPPAAITTNPTPKDAKIAEEQKISMERHQAELQQLRKKLHESLAINKAKALESTKQEAIPLMNDPQTIDLGLGYSSEEEISTNKDDSSILEESSVVSSSDDSDDSPDEADSDDDAPPKEQSAKICIPPVVAPPPPPISTIATPTFKYCIAWRQYGKCKHGSSCRYEHPRRQNKKKEEEKKPTGLFERLVEQENERADRLALDAIKYLGRHGFLG